MDYTVTDFESLRKLCIKHKWFTAGSNEQYDKLFDANESGLPIEAIAAMIYVCSDGWWYGDILEILYAERTRYALVNS